MTQVMRGDQSLFGEDWHYFLVREFALHFQRNIFVKHGQLEGQSPLCMKKKPCNPSVDLFWCFFVVLLNMVMIM